jgi:C-terminal processing protease CtpA/Prc
MALIARVNDTHANLWSSMSVQPPRGKAQLPVRVRFVEGKAVVTGYTHATLGLQTGLKVGDAILAMDGVPVDTLVERWRPMYAASNEPTRLRDVARALTRGDAGPVRLAILREGSPLDVVVTRAPLDSLDGTAGTTHDLPGPTFRRLGSDIAYLKLSSVRTDSVGSYLRGIAGARALVIDIRNYPSAFLVFELGKHLVKEATPFVSFTFEDIRNPGAFVPGPTNKLLPGQPYFEGGVAILVDEETQSQAEYTTMAFRSRPGAVVVGSTTAGADGNVSSIPLPGGLRTMISGIGIFYPDKRPTQRVGIVPDLVVRPTISGIRAGRDEVLEAAVQRLLGRPMTAAELAATR